MNNDKQKPSPATVRAKVRPNSTYARRENGTKRRYTAGEWVEVTAEEFADPVIAKCLVTDAQEKQEADARAGAAKAKAKPAAETMAAMKAAGRAAFAQAKKAAALRADTAAEANSAVAAGIRAGR